MTGNDEEDGSLRTSSKTKKKIAVKRPWIIYPENKFIRIWDILILILIFFYSFSIPYSIAVSGGIHFIEHFWWFITMVIMNACFFVDTFLHFFRAYQDPSGKLIIDPKNIRRQYFKSLFVPNLISNMPTTIIIYIQGQRFLMGETEPDEDIDSWIKLFDLLKLLRLGRAGRLLSTSDSVREFRENRKAFTLQLYIFIFLIVVASHWFACIWCWVAYLQCGGWNETKMLTTNNWIGLWYNSSYVEGGLNPLGWQNDIDRYILSLFWAIQTITSIGYGNIMPLTRAEWFIGAVLQLLAGILWAYIIGGLVGVVTAMEVKNEMFRGRIDAANSMISVFMRNEGNAIRDAEDLRERYTVAKKIRRFIYTQTERENSTYRYASTFETAFPVLESLSPQLQRSASLLMIRKFWIECRTYHPAISAARSSLMLHGDASYASFPKKRSYSWNIVSKTMGEVCLY